MSVCGAQHSTKLSEPVDYFLWPGTDAKISAYNACCAPSKVNVVDECWYWCEVPDAYGKDSANSTAFIKCMSDHGVDTIAVTEGTPTSAATKPPTSVMKLSALLLVAGFMLAM
ncbi:hypothetical protein GQ53DRAFT_864868 [Thozetella sp. PMI_491]|nr:hypothetical protein GQ53DRAFT_864868 [Thozetella sp. PMI_491]